MKKILLLIILTISISYITSAQTTFGIKGGMNVSHLTNSSFGSIKNKNLIGFYGGGLVNFPIAKSCSIQPELLYSLQGNRNTSIMFTDFNGNLLGEAKAKKKLTYLSIPVMVQYKFHSSFYAEVGPQVHFLAAGKDKMTGAVESETDIKEYYEKTYASLSLGAGCYIKNSPLGVNVRYDLGLTEVNEGGRAVRNNVLQIGMFYKFKRQL